MSDELKTTPKINPDHTGDQTGEHDQGRRVDYPRRTLSHEEYAAEFDSIRDRKVMANHSMEESNVGGAGRVVGIIGIVLGVLALFMWTIVLGPIAAVLGYLAYSQGTRTMGAWGLALGIVATLSYFVLIPFVR